MSKILIIDDDPDAVSYLEAILTDNGYETFSASDGAEGLRLAREAPPRLILLDLMMPGIGGGELVRKALPVRPELKVVLGGPEVSYHYVRILEKHPQVDFIVVGAGS